MTPNPIPFHCQMSPTSCLGFSALAWSRCSAEWRLTTSRLLSWKFLQAKSEQGNPSWDLVCSTLDMKEASALLAGVSMTSNMGIQKIIVEGDNLTVINAINGKWKTPWRIKDTIEEIKEALKKFTFYKTSHCYREENRAADFLASKCNCISSLNCNQTLREFHTIIRQDVLGFSFARRIV